MSNSQTASRSTAQLLTAGILAGPFFIVLSLVQAFTREGFDWVRHPASLLSLGDLGWIQIACFVLTGLLYIAGGIGLGRVLTEGIGRTWVKRLFVSVGIAMIMGGVFVADPGLGFPPGTPEGVPQEMSGHAAIHGFAPILGFFSLVGAFLVLARRFGSQNRRPWMWTTIVIATTTLILTALPNFTADWEIGRFNFLPLWAGVSLGYFYASAVIAKLKTELRDEQSLKG